jgi:hypothetical protein
MPLAPMIWAMGLLISFFLFFYFAGHPYLRAETPENLKKSEDRMRQEMIVISRQLGVTCTECHNVKNFKDNAKVGFKVGKLHIKSVEMLKANGFSGENGEPLASCFLCHQGQLHFSYKEKINDHNRHEAKIKNSSDKNELLDKSEIIEKAESH